MRLERLFEFSRLAGDRFLGENNVAQHKTRHAAGLQGIGREGQNIRRLVLLPPFRIDLADRGIVGEQQRKFDRMLREGLLLEFGQMVTRGFQNRLA